ncbi:MAG TPA: aspartyl protease family protein [Polyangia bacterium]|jgi:predicted aspartyl protease
MAVAARVGMACFVVLAAPACALPPWIGHPPVFPAGSATSWAIPLYEPLTGFGPKVIATVCGPPGPGKPRACEQALLYVDSGSSHSALPAATFARLGVETTGSHFATIENAAGEKRAWSGGVVPEVRLGDLVLSDVVAMVHDQQGILGLDVLTAHGWRLDLDRGVLVLGAPPAPAAPPAARLPIRGFPARTIVDLSVQGRVVPLLLDTGAAFTVVDAAWLKAAGLPLRRLDHGWPLSARDPTLRLGEASDADVRLGDQDLGRRPIVAHPRAPEGSDRGMLGLDLLSDYAFGVSAGVLELVRRASSPLAGAAERVERWRDMPPCPGLPGCVAAQVEPGTGARVRVRTAASSPRAWRYLFGCVDRDARPAELPFWIEIGIRAATAGQERVVDIPMPERMQPIWRLRCASLVLLDVNPVLPVGRPLTSEVEGRFTFGNRRLRLD